MSEDEFDLTISDATEPPVPGRRLNNFAATTAPTATDDENDGYEIGSKWVDTVGEAFYVCVKATAGAAVWSSGGGGSVPGWGAAGDLAQIDYADAADAGATGLIPDAGHQHPVNAKFQHASLTFEFGPAAAVNDYHTIPIPFDFTPVGWRIIGDVSGSVTFGVWMDVLANGQPTVADNAVASAPPTLSSAIQGSSTTLTGWNTTWVRGDLLKVIITALTTMTQVAVEFYGNKT